MRPSATRSMRIGCFISSLLILGCDTSPPQNNPGSSDSSETPNSTESSLGTTSSPNSPTPGPQPSAAENVSIYDRPTPPEGLEIDPEFWKAHAEVGRKSLVQAALQKRGAAIFKTLGIKDPRPEYDLENWDQMIGFYALSSQRLSGTESFTDAAFDELVKHQATLRSLELNEMDTTEEQGRRLPELENLEVFIYNGGALPQTFLESIPSLSRLKKCTLIDVNLDDEQLSAIQFPSTLRVLDLRTNVGFTDASIPVLSQLTQLEELSLAGTGISDAGRRELQSALPNCKVMPAPR